MNKKMPLVSVIIPAYNVEKFLDDCLTSVSTQSYANLEIILVDDGSSDMTSILCDEWAKKDDRIHVVHQCNQGLSAARNTGTVKSAGDYILYVDSDDEIGKYHVETLMRAICATGSLISVTGFEKYTSSHSSNRNVADSVKVLTGEEALQMALMGGDIGFYAWGKLYSSKLKSLLAFPEGRAYEDQSIMYRVFDEAKHIAYVDANDYYYRSRDTSISNSTRVNITDSYLAFKEMEDYCSDKYPALMEPIRARKFSACAEAYSALMCTKNPLQEKYYRLLKIYANEARKNLYLKKSIKAVFRLAALNRSVLNCALWLFNKMR